ncbi:MAG: nicotinate-nucleotide adenylyltransferase [Methylococcales bacterium]
MIAVLGGSFDPIHIGHLRIAIEVRDQLQVDEVRLIPCGQPPHRDPFIANADQRLQMLQLAIADEPALRVDDREIRHNRLSYTVDTLTDLRQEVGHQPLCLIIGADAYQQLNSWHQWTQLLELAHLLVVQRPGYSVTTSAEVANYTANRFIEDTQQLTQQNAGSVYFLQAPPLEISSTRIKTLLAEHKSIRYLVPDSVFQWLQQNPIYHSAQ